MMHVPTTAFVLPIVFFLHIYQTESCNDAVCGSVVSKCQLTESCNCESENITCYKECFACLRDLYSECCSCVGMCPTPNKTEQNLLNQKSHVEDFTERVSGLFEILTKDSDPLYRWTRFTFPVDFYETFPSHQKDVQLFLQSTEEITIKQANITTLNCTVVFMSECMSWTKCRNSCQSIGASSYRWFHDSCCECVGETCINYGIKKSRCQNCHIQDDINFNTIDNSFRKDNFINYDENMDYEDYEDYEDYLDDYEELKDGSVQ